MFRFTFRDLLWSMMVVVVSLGILAVGQSGYVATIEGNACSVIAITVLAVGLMRIYRQAQSRRSHT
jgi:hypothetical protein